MLYALSLDVYKLKYATQQKKSNATLQIRQIQKIKILSGEKKSFTSIGMLVIGCCLSYILQIGSETAIKEELQAKILLLGLFFFVGYNSE